MKFKEFFLILATASVLFCAVFGTALVLQPQPPSAAPAMEQVASVVPTVPTPEMGEQAKQGKKLFALNCAHCHADDATGDEGPSLYDLTKSDARITKILKEGIKGEMPKFGSKFSDTDIQQLIAFLRTLKGETQPIAAGKS